MPDVIPFQFGDVFGDVSQRLRLHETTIIAFSDDGIPRGCSGLGREEGTV